MGEVVAVVFRGAQRDVRKHSRAEDDEHCNALAAFERFAAPEAARPVLWLFS